MCCECCGLCELWVCLMNNNRRGFVWMPCCMPLITVVSTKVWLCTLVYVGSGAIVISSSSSSSPEISWIVALDTQMVQRRKKPQINRMRISVWTCDRLSIRGHKWWNIFYGSQTILPQFIGDAQTSFRMLVVDPNVLPSIPPYLSLFKLSFFPSEYESHIK